MSAPKAVAVACPNCGDEVFPAMARCRGCGHVLKPVGKPGGGSALPAAEKPRSSARTNVSTPSAASVAQLAKAVLKAHNETQTRTADSAQGMPSARKAAPASSPMNAIAKPIETSASRGTDRSTESDRPTVSELSTESDTPRPANRRDVVFTLCVCGTKLAIPRGRASREVECPSCRKSVPVPSALFDDTEKSAGTGTLPFHHFTELAATLRDQIAKEHRESRPARKTLGRLRLNALKRVLTGKSAEVSQDERKDAMTELGESRDPRAFDLLVPLLNPDKESHVIREAAVSALGACGDRRAVPEILPLLDPSHSRLHTAALIALGRLADRRTIRPLIQYGLEHPHQKYVASDSIVKMEEPAVLELLDVLSDSDPGLVLEAVVLLGRLKNPRAVPALMQVAETRSPLFRAHAAESLGSIGDRRAVPVLNRLLRDPDPAIRVNAAGALVHIPDPQSVKPLLQCLAEDDEDLCQHAIRALGEIGDARAAEPLRPFLQHKNVEIRLVAAESLGRLGDEGAVQPLIAMMRSDEEAVRLKAISALRRIKSPAALVALLPLLQDNSDAVRLRAVDTLGHIGDAGVARKLEYYLKNDRSEAVRAAAAKSLGDLKNVDSIEPLIDALRDVFAVKCRAIVSLGQIGDSSGLGAVISMLRDPIPEARFHACCAVAELAPSNAVELLEPLIDDSNAMVRRGCGKALQKLGDPRGESLARDAASPNLRRSVKQARANAAEVIRSLAPNWLVGLLWPSTLKGKAIAIGGIAAALAVGWVVLEGSMSSWFIPSEDKVYLRGAAASVAIRPDGAQVAVSRSVALVEVFGAGGTRQKWLKQMSGGAAYLPDGRTLAFVSDTGLSFWRIDSERAPGNTVAGHSSPITTIALAPAGDHAATLDAAGVVVEWDLTSSSPRAALQLPKNVQPVMALSPGGKSIATLNLDGLVTLWEFETASESASFTWEPKGIQSMAFSPDGDVLAIGGNNSLKLWSRSTSKTEDVPGVSGNVSSLSYAPGGKRLVFLSGATVQIVDTGDKSMRSIEIAGSEGLGSISIAADGRTAVVCGSEDVAAFLVDLESATMVRKIDVP